MGQWPLLLTARASGTANCCHEQTSDYTGSGEVFPWEEDPLFSLSHYHLSALSLLTPLLTRKHALPMGPWREPHTRGGRRFASLEGGLGLAHLKNFLCKRPLCRDLLLCSSATPCTLGHSNLTSS